MRRKKELLAPRGEKVFYLSAVKFGGSKTNVLMLDLFTCLVEWQVLDKLRGRKARLKMASHGVRAPESQKLQLFLSLSGLSTGKAEKAAMAANAAARSCSRHWRGIGRKVLLGAETKTTVLTF